MSVEDVVKDAKPRMEAAVEDFKKKMANIRTGRATVGILDTVMVDYYGTPTPINQMGSISVPEAQMLLVSPWDASQVGAIEKAIRNSDLGLNPSSDGKAVRVPIPALNEERRKQMAKQVHDLAEEHRTAVRNVRRDANDKLKKHLKDKAISEDNEKDGLDQVQKLTNTNIARLDELMKTKEAEIMSV